MNQTKVSLYTPQPFQLDWHENPTRFLVAVCGRQIGKTTAIINDAIKSAITEPNQRIWYVTNDYKQAKRNVWDELKKWMPKAFSPQFNESELKCSLPNGSKIELIGVDNVESLRGAVVHKMYLDEYADFAREVFPKVLRPMLSTTGGGVWFMGTPKGLGNDFHDKYMEAEQDHEFTRYKIPAIEDGKPISKYALLEEILSAQRQDMTPTKEVFRQEYLADFTRPTGTVYAEWPIENFKKCPYSVDLPIHVSWDFGVNDPTSIGIYQPNGSEIRLIDYTEISDANLETAVAWLNSRPYKKPELHTGDVAGRQRNQVTGVSPIDYLNSKGIAVRTMGGLKIPDQIRETHTIIPSLIINSESPGCTLARDAILNYRYPTWGVEKTSKINLENEVPIHNEYSHFGRQLEYYVVNSKGLNHEEIFIPPMDLMGGERSEGYTL